MNSTLKRVLITTAVLACAVHLFRSAYGPDTARAAVDPLTGLPPKRPTSAKFVGIYLAEGDKGWELADLYEAAADWLAKKENAPLEVRTNATVTIYLNTNALCLFSFTYARPLGKNVWLITMGTDGKVAQCLKSKAAEGFPSQIPVPPPPPDKFIEPAPK